MSDTAAMPIGAPTPPVLSGRRVPAWLIALMLALVTVAIYWPATRCDFINYDDPGYVTDNPRVRGGLTWDNVEWALTAERAQNWHPLTWLSLMLDASVFGIKPAGFHLTNILWHALDVVLLFWLLRRMTGTLWRSALVAALFGWHPAHVQSVAWVAERKDMLSTFFGLLTLLFYTKYSKARISGRRSGSGFYWLALGCFVLGLLSKPMLVTWPFVMLLLDYWPLGRWQPGQVGRLVVEKVPFLALALAACVVTFVAQKHGGAVVPVAELSLSDRAANALISYGRYLGMLAWPVDLAVFYPRPHEWPAEEVAVAVAALAGFTMFVYGERRRCPWLFTGWLWYVGTLVPVIGLVQVGEQAMADRYTYIPSVGIFIMVAWGVSETARTRQRLLIVGAVSGAALAGCLLGTWHQLGYWRNSKVLFRHDLAVTKDNFVAHDNLGEALLEEDQMEAAIGEYHAALSLAPDFPDAQNNLGIAFFRNGQNDEAVKEFQEILRNVPDYTEAHNNLGSVLIKEGRQDEAIIQFEKTLALNPDSPQAHDNLGMALAGANQTEAAIRQFEAACRLRPDNSYFRNNLALALSDAGRVPEAIEQWRASLHYHPEDATVHANLGNALAQAGQIDAAIPEWQEALRLDPDAVRIQQNLDIALSRKGEGDQTIHEFEDAIRLRPNFAGAHNNLALALARRERLPEAVEQWREAIRLKPDDSVYHENLGRALASHNQTAAASREFQEAVRLAPGDAGAHNDLGMALAQQGRWEESLSQFREALRLEPGSARFHVGAGIVLANQGQMAAAADEFREAVRLKPDYAKAHDNLGIVLGRLGRLEEAIHEFREALRLQPGYADAQKNLDAALSGKKTTN